MEELEILKASVSCNVLIDACWTICSFSATLILNSPATDTKQIRLKKSPLIPVTMAEKRVKLNKQIGL